MCNLVGGVMTPPYERQVLGLTAYYSGCVVLFVRNFSLFYTTFTFLR